MPGAIRPHNQWPQLVASTELMASAGGPLARQPTQNLIFLRRNVRPQENSIQAIGTRRFTTKYSYFQFGWLEPASSDLVYRWDLLLRYGLLLNFELY